MRQPRTALNAGTQGDQGSLSTSMGVARGVTGTRGFGVQACLLAGVLGPAGLGLSRTACEAPSFSGSAWETAELWQSHEMWGFVTHGLSLSQQRHADDMRVADKETTKPDCGGC